MNKFMKCMHCGKEITGSEALCPHCGKNPKEIERGVKVELTEQKKGAGPVGFGGWLYIPVIYFLLVFPILAITDLFLLMVAFDYFFAFVDIVIAVYAIYAAVLLIRVKPMAKKHSMNVLWLSLGSMVLWGIAVFWLFELEDSSYVVESLLRGVFFSVVWLWYFRVSTRVKNTYAS